MKNYKIELYRDEASEWRFRVKASNGRIVAEGGEGYKTKFFCNRNAKKLMEKLANASVQVKEPKKTKKETVPPTPPVA